MPRSPIPARVHAMLQHDLWPTHGFMDDVLALTLCPHTAPQSTTNYFGVVDSSSLVSIYTLLLPILDQGLTKMSDTTGAGPDALITSSDPSHPANLICELCRKFYTHGWVKPTFRQQPHGKRVVLMNFDET